MDEEIKQNSVRIPLTKICPRCSSYMQGHPDPKFMTAKWVKCSCGFCQKVFDVQVAVSEETFQKG